MYYNARPYYNSRRSKGNDPERRAWRTVFIIVFFPPFDKCIKTFDMSRWRISRETLTGRYVESGAVRKRTLSAAGRYCAEIIVTAETSSYGTTKRFYRTMGTRALRTKVPVGDERKDWKKSEPLGSYINKCTSMESGFLQRNKVISSVVRTRFIIYFARTIRNTTSFVNN